MTILLLGLAVFFVPHLYSSFRTRAPAADIKQRIGETPYMGLYSFVSALGLVLIVWGYSLAPVGEYLLMPVSVGGKLTHVLMMLAFISLTATYTSPGYLKKIVKHPMLLGVGLWGVAHLIDGANLKQLLLFGSFALYSIIDVIAVTLRDKGVSSRSPQVKILNDFITIVVGLIFYFLFAHYLHQWLFGFNPHVA